MDTVGAQNLRINKTTNHSRRDGPTNSSTLRINLEVLEKELILV